MKYMQDCYLVANEHSHVQYMCESREQAEEVVIMLEEKTRWFWFVRRSWHTEDSINSVIKSIKRHERKEIKRAAYGARQVVKEIERAAREANKANKEIRAILNRINYINFMACHIVGKGVESDISDMTSEEKQDWTNKFFSAL